jgi:hypothetical protein
MGFGNTGWQNEGRLDLLLVAIAFAASIGRISALEGRPLLAR